jgi:hypothetical protein
MKPSTIDSRPSLLAPRLSDRPSDRPWPLRFLPILVFFGVLISYGIAEGLWTHRWFASAELEQATARLARVPRVVGDWEGTDQELDARTIAVADLSGYVMRRYVNRRTGAAVSMLLVCGRPGPTAQHTPEVCYVGAGFTAKEAPTHAAISIPPPLTKGGLGGVEAPADFWLAHYNKGGPTPEALRIYWAWNATGTWQASAKPRFEFAHRAALYKLYVVRQLSKANEPLTDEPATQFLEVFLPIVHRALFGDENEGREARGEGRARKENGTPVAFATLLPFQPTLCPSFLAPRPSPLVPHSGRFAT